jgi:acyl-coenzyme A thioesterase 13
MPIEKQHLNIQDRLFGGVTASLVDIGGSLAIAAKTSSLHTGVSTDLSISYLRSAKLGDMVRYFNLMRMESECTKVGRTLAFTRVELFVGEKLIATGNHTKFMGQGNSPNE